MSKRTVFITLAVICTLSLVVIISMPETSQKIFGTRLAHRLQAGRAENIVTVAQILCGNEIRPISKDGNTLPSGNVNTENYDVRCSMMEMVQSVGTEEVVTYSVNGIESEQIGTKGASDMIGNIYRLRVNLLGLPISLTRTEGEQSHVWDDMRLTQALESWWPALPDKRVRKGDSWNGRWNFPYKVDVLDGRTISLQHDLQYFLEDVRVGNGMNIANITYKGSIVPTDLGELPENTEIAGTGIIAGNIYVNVANGQTLVADERLIWSVVVRMLDDDIEVVKFADRNSRTYRPRYLPNGDNGFSKNIESTTNESGLPTAGDLMPDMDKLNDSFKSSGEKSAPEKVNLTDSKSSKS